MGGACSGVFASGETSGRAYTTAKWGDPKLLAAVPSSCLSSQFLPHHTRRLAPDNSTTTALMSSDSMETKYNIWDAYLHQKQL